jgi:hypothetical protein
MAGFVSLAQWAAGDLPLQAADSLLMDGCIFFSVGLGNFFSCVWALWQGRKKKLAP